MSTHHLRPTSRVLPVAALLAAALVIVMAALRREVSVPRVAHIGAVLDHGLSRVSAHPSWIAMYGIIAMAVAALILVVAHRSGRAGAGDHILAVAVAAGTLWPLILLGLTQLAVLAGVRALITRNGTVAGPDHGVTTGPLTACR